MAKPDIEAEVRGKRIFRIGAPFNLALAGLRSKGIESPMTSEELAYARTNHPEGRQSSLMASGSYTLAGFAYMKGENPIRMASSPLLNRSLAKQATKENKAGRYFATKDEMAYGRIARMAEEDKSRKPEERRAIVLPSRSKFQISSTQNSEVFANIFGKAGKKYLEFLGFDSLTLYLVDSSVVDAQNGTILTQEWLAGLDLGSAVGGNLRSLLYNGAVRGVQLVTGEASSQKTDKVILPYTPQDLKKAKKELGRLSQIFVNLSGLVSKLRRN
ncbi:MAG: hypothetical protein AABX07_03230 [Nanoarchaeota archaeon]